jgi:hypothetical protein
MESSPFAAELRRGVCGNCAIKDAAAWGEFCAHR